MGSNGYVNAEELLRERYREVSTSRGMVKIRRLTYAETIGLRGGLLDVAEMADKGAREKALAAIGGGQGRGALEGVAAVVNACVVEPKLSADPEAGLTADDFILDDQLAIFVEAMQMTGLSAKASAQVRPSSPTSDQ